MSATSSMDMAATGTMDMDMASSTAEAMDMGGGMGYTPGQCRISMLWNWYTIDACFLADTWHIRSTAMYAGSCIGVVLLTISLEFLRRTVKEYDRYLIRQHLDHQDSAAVGDGASSNGSKGVDRAAACAPMTPFRPSVLQQAVRAFLHMTQFAVAYIIMLLAMYFNGGIILSIFAGAFVGAFIFQWETLSDRASATSATQTATVCCG